MIGCGENAVSEFPMHRGSVISVLWPLVPPFGMRPGVFRTTSRTGPLIAARFGAEFHDRHQFNRGSFWGTGISR